MLQVIQPVIVLFAKDYRMVDIEHRNLAMIADIDKFVSQISSNL